MNFYQLKHEKNLDKIRSKNSDPILNELSFKPNISNNAIGLRRTVDDLYVKLLINPSIGNTGKMKTCIINLLRKKKMRKKFRSKARALLKWTMNPRYYLEIKAREATILRK